MTTFVEGQYTGEYLLAEANGTRSREKIILTMTGVALSAGQVLGRVTATGKYKVYNTANSDGSQVAAAILYANCPAFTGDFETVAHVRDCEVNAADLIGAGVDAGTKATAYAALLATTAFGGSIVART